ncbi:MAG: glycosyltransferase family 4 protein [Thermoleophilia bacterium]|nr:glycosyltransferase family 4 protein [Thermoleophilia bacterium]
MTLHVLHLIGGGDTGGAMSHLLPLLSALERSGCDVHLACLGEGGLAREAERRGFRVSVLPMGGPRDPRVIRPLRRLLCAGPAGIGEGERSGGEVAAAGCNQATRWDVVHTHGMRANLPTRLASRGLRDRPCLFTTVHSDLRLDYTSTSLARVYEGLDRATVDWVDGIVCVSEALKTLLVERGYPVERLTTVHSGLETVDYPVHQKDPAARPRIGTVARLVAVKDVDLMLEVVGRLRRTHPQVELVVVGDGPERARLEALAGEMGLAQAVCFAGSLEDVGPTLGFLDVYLVTSVFEGGVSMSVLEAMAAGLPVVTTAAGGVAEVVVDGESGYVVGRDQERGALAAALAERAAALLSDPGLRARMGAAGARRVRAHFTVDQTAALVRRAYERCLAARGRYF